jgi:hypothetical protein
MTQPAPPKRFDEDDLDDGLDEAWEDATDEQPLLPERKRIRWLSWKSVALLAILTGLIGFYAGVREEKSSAAGTSSTAVASATGSSTRGFAGFAGRGAAGKSATKSGGKSGSFPGFGSAGGPPSGAAAAGNGSFGGGTSGTIVSVSGDTLYVKESSGNTVKVKLLATTTLTKSVDVGTRSLHPGDTVSIQGDAGSHGTVTATSVSDSGDSSTSTSSTSSALSSGTG